jgi:transcriptional regulator with XRE-family HTH domain
MTDNAISEEIGERFRQLRLRKNYTLALLSDRTLISINTLKAQERGKTKLDTMIAVLRELGELDELNHLIAPIVISPIQLAKMNGKQRQRARLPKNISNQEKWVDKW